MKKTFILYLSILVFLSALTGNLFAQKDQIAKIWYNPDKTSRIEIYEAKDGTFCGRVCWIKDSLDKDTGKPKTDKENPDDALKSRAVKGLVIMKGFKKNPDNKNEYKDGSIYDPKKGKTYCGKISCNGTSLDLRGYLCSLTFLGRSETWTLVEGQ